MIVFFFGSFIIGAIILYVAQKPKTKQMRIVLRIVGFLCLAFPFLVGIWGNYIAPFFNS